MATGAHAFDERLPVALAIAASLAVHAAVLVLPAWTHPHPQDEPPAPLVVALQPASVAVAAPESARREGAARPAASSPSAPAPAPRHAEVPPPRAPTPAPRSAPASPRPPPPRSEERRDTASVPGVPATPPAPPAPSLGAAAESSAAPVAADAPGARAPTGPPAATTASAAPNAPATTPPSYGAAYLRNPAPRYPAEARRSGAEGTVMLRVWVAADGAATRVEVDRSSGHRALDEAALAAVKNWRFVPAQRGGAPVEGLVTVPLVFRLDGSG